MYYIARGHKVTMKKKKTLRAQNITLSREIDALKETLSGFEAEKKEAHKKLVSAQKAVVRKLRAEIRELKQRIAGYKLVASKFKTKEEEDTE